MSNYLGAYFQSREEAPSYGGRRGSSRRRLPSSVRTRKTESNEHSRSTEEEVVMVGGYMIAIVDIPHHQYGQSRTGIGRIFATIKGPLASEDPLKNFEAELILGDHNRFSEKEARAILHAFDPNLLPLRAEDYDY